MSVRCKLVCTHKSLHPYQFDDGTVGQSASLTFTAVHADTKNEKGEHVSYVQTCEENKIFGKWTPSASFTTCIVNEHAHQQFEVGVEYYFDIIRSDTKEHSG